MQIPEQYYVCDDAATAMGWTKISSENLTYGKCLWLLPANDQIVERWPIVNYLKPDDWESQFPGSI